MPFKQTAWSLDDLFPGTDSPELEDAFNQLEVQVEKFEKYRPDLKHDMDVEQFMEILTTLEQSTRISSKLEAFAGLAFAADTQSQAIQTLLSRIQQFLAELTNRTLFFSLWWKSLEDDQAKRFLAVAGDYHYYLEALRNFKPHTLSEAEEKVINLKNVTGSQALVTMYDAITNRYVFKVEVEGQVKEMTRGELAVLVRSSDPNLRARAYQELYRVYAADGDILGQMYQTLIRDWRNENISLRKFSNPIATRNLINDIPDEAVDTLLAVCQKNAVIFQRFFKLKAKQLNLERLRRCDIYAPVSESEKKFDFNQAVEMVLEAFEDFDPQVAQLSRRVFEDNHIDSEVRKGKQSGAFCWGPTPDLTPWVKLNYQGLADDVATMAHELGHAVHGMLASDHTVFTFNSSLPLAETASTFGEMLLIDKMLAEEQDASVRRDILFRQVDDSYATVMRQAYFALFERQAHDLVLKNASVAELANAYMKNLEDQFSDAVEISDEFKWEWVSIPHFYHVPFYVYAYTFGQLLVLSLYKQYKAEGDAFKPRYLNILSAGGSQAPVKILSNAGIDIKSAAFWQGGFDVIANLVEELEKIA